MCPTREGRALFVASGVARRLRCLAPRRNALLTGYKNRRGETGQYQRPLVLPGSHIGEAMAHEDRYHARNMLTRGQEISEPIDEAKAVSMPLQPGEMSVHDVRLAHASGPNRSEDRRIGVSLHFMPTRTRQSLGDWDSAALVRGSDAYGNFHHTPVLATDLDGAAVAFHDRATRAVREILYRDARQATGKL